MSAGSKRNAADPFDLDRERDMPLLTAEDLEALARARNLRLLSPEDYQRVDLLAK